MASGERPGSRIDGIPKKWLAMAELEATEPTLTQDEIMERIKISKKTIWTLHHNEVYMDLYHKACERHFRSLESLAISTLKKACDKGNVIAAQYLLNYKGYKPQENINISSGDININITEDD